jgi:acyl-CoA thioester hydrolase
MRDYTRAFRVRHYELDSFGHVNNAVYVNYLQEAAIEASSDAGFTPLWYAEHNVGWVIRKLSIRYYLQASYGDELNVTTWISDIRRVSSTREYIIRRQIDGIPVVRARVQWVFVDRNSGQPARIPESFKLAFSSMGDANELDIRWAKPQLIDCAHRYSNRRRVQTNELDTAQHVNHAAYLRWIEQAYFDAIRAAGHPIETTRNSGWLVVQGAHEIEYFAPAFDNDEIEVVSWVCEMGKVRGAWTHEIYCSNRQSLLARDYSVGIFVNGNGKPISPPQATIQDILRGPSR